MVGHAYRLTAGWAHTDVFCYFSHARLTIPPPGWVAAARAHGVPVLGTLITEWADGEAGNGLLVRQALSVAAGSDEDDGGAICPLARALAPATLPRL